MAFGGGPADRELLAAWEAFCAELSAAGASAFKDAVPPDPVTRTDALRFLTRNLGQAFQLALETRDPDFPQIHYFTNPTMKLGFDVSDFTYRQAWISGANTYRISGRRGTARWFNLTVQGERPPLLPGSSRANLHEPFGDVPEVNLFGHQLETDADGNFEIWLGGPERKGNWLPTTQSTRKLFIREAFDAWYETPTQLTIERVGLDAPPAPPGVSRMIDALAWAGQFVSQMMQQWPEHSWQQTIEGARPYPANAFPAKQGDAQADAKRGRMAANMPWTLDRDEALIVEMDAHDGFWLFSMQSPYGGSMDFMYRPVSYTPARTKVDEDGVIRLVISHRDPGVHNWLDTQGFPSGYLGYRNVMGVAPTSFRTSLVDLSELSAVLPASTAVVSPPERVQQLEDRFRSVKLRFGL